MTSIANGSRIEVTRKPDRISRIRNDLTSLEKALGKCVTMWVQYYMSYCLVGWIMIHSFVEVLCHF